MATKGNVIFSQNPDFAKRSDEEHGQIAEWLEQLKNYWELEEQDKKKEDSRKENVAGGDTWGPIPKQIVDKIEKRNELNKEIGKWCKDNLDMEGMYAGGAEITDYHTGEEQGTEKRKEWCDQTVRRHIVGGTYRTLISVQNPLRLCRTGICRSLSAG